MPPESLAMMPSHDSAERPLFDELLRQVGPRNFEHWFREKTRLTAADDELTVGVGSPFLLSWMQKHFRAELSATAQALLGPSARVRFEVDALVCVPPESAEGGPRKLSAAAAKQSRNSRPAAGTADAPRPAGAAAEPPGRQGRRFADLADFVEGKCNELATTATRQVCDSPGDAYNPLFIHGSVGMGKTHLLEGIYRRLRRQFPALRVTFLTSEAFVNYFTQALREHTVPSFRQRFRNVDVLLVDDVDFFEGKRVMQEEFLHTFKQLESHGRQIVLTSDRHPRLLDKLSDELVTRFLSGLVCRLESPDADTRRRIVERKAAKVQADISPEALRFVADRFKNNVRELEGAINCLATYRSLHGKTITLSAARHMLADLERDCIRIVGLADIEQAVCNLFRLEPDDLKSPRRHRSVSQPRMLAMYLARKLTQAAYSEIGQYFGGRNHSTVVSAEKKVRDWLADRTPIKIASQAWTLDDLLKTLEQQLQAS
jgi:chromosomal replication initiator protein